MISFSTHKKSFFYIVQMIFSTIIKKNIHQIKIPSVDITRYLSQTGQWQQDCKQVAQIFKTYGLIIIKDPRVNAAQNDNFLDLMERYFTKRSRQYFEGNKNIDISPESNFQMGIMHEFQQKFQSYQNQKNQLKDPFKALTPINTSRDPKWRFHWRVKDPQNIIPADFPQWQTTMNSWGNNMFNGSITVAKMLAIGLGLQPNFFADTIINGRFHLSPTAADLERTKVGDVLAAFHRDFDLLTIHGKARFPGLFAWLNTGQKFTVRVPQGHLLLQAGKQLEWFSGGVIKAGFHEVIHTQETQQVKLKAKQNNKSLWRISSTMFCQVQDQYILKPHTKFATAQTQKLYPPITAFDYLQSQLYSLTEVK